MGFIINSLLILSIAATIIPAWFLTVRFGLFASVLGTLALAGGSFVLEALGNALEVGRSDGPWTLSLLGAASMWGLVLAGVFLFGSVGGLMRRNRLQRCLEGNE